jgi:type VI secretion system protein ImpH
VAQEDPDRSVRRDFLDLFHHRLLSLLYRELTRFQLWAEQTKSLRDHWSCRLFALLGLDTYEKSLPVDIAPSDILRLAPVLVLQSRTAAGLELSLDTILGDYLEGGQVRVCEFAGGWVSIDPPERTRLGTAKHQLGREVVLGRRAYDRAGSFEIQLGPVWRHVYERFLPEGDLAAMLHQVVSLFARDPLGYRVMVQLREGEAPHLRLASSGGNRLGRDSWLGLRKERTWVRTYPVPSENKPEPIAVPFGRA